MTDLQEALTEITAKQIHPVDLHKAFDEIAVSLLRRTKIVTPNEQFYLREIEIYFYDKAYHPDPYTHKNKRQGEFGEWYFHRFADIRTFLNSNRNGIDITFGNKALNRFGGLLIRKIQNIRTKELIVGINKVAREIIRNIGENNANEIALGTGKQAFDNTQILHLEVEENNFSAPVYKTQRNGLPFKDDEVSIRYFKIPYCYYNHNLNISQIIEVRPAI